MLVQKHVLPSTHPNWHAHCALTTWISSCYNMPATSRKRSSRGFFSDSLVGFVRPKTCPPSSTFRYGSLPKFFPMLAFINRFADGLKATGPGLLAFVAVELDLAFYQCTPSRYFPSAKFVNCKRAGCPGHERYTAILKALGGRHKQRDVGDWKVPLTHDQDVAHVLDIVRRLCASIGFVPDWSIISADDDHLRWSSNAQVDVAGLQYQKNPVKGAGVVHSMVSVTSGLYLGGHVAARNETVADCMETLSRSLARASMASNAVISNIIARDRGYNGDETRRAALAQGSDVVGTTSRSRSMRFTFGQVIDKSPTSISESGSRCAYWAARRYYAERDVEHEIRQFVERHGNGLKVVCHKQDGLLCHRRQHEAAFSPEPSGCPALSPKRNFSFWNGI